MPRQSCRCHLPQPQDGGRLSLRISARLWKSRIRLRCVVSGKCHAARDLASRRPPLGLHFRIQIPSSGESLAMEPVVFITHQFIIHNRKEMIYTSLWRDLGGCNCIFCTCMCK